MATQLEARVDGHELEVGKRDSYLVYKVNVFVVIAGQDPARGLLALVNARWRELE